MGAPQSYPRSERITRRNDYLALYREGKKRTGRDFICYTLRREGQGRKFGFAVSRKVGKAVVRNRIKRYLREIYRTHRNALDAHLHVVVVARPGCATLDYRQCRAALCELLGPRKENARKEGVAVDETRHAEAPSTRGDDRRGGAGCG